MLANRPCRSHSADIGRETKEWTQASRGARETVDGWLTGPAQELLAVPDVQAYVLQLLREAGQNYDRFAAKREGDWEVEIERARAYLRLGQAQAQLLGFSDASEAFEPEGGRIAGSGRIAEISHPDLGDTVEQPAAMAQALVHPGAPAGPVECFLNINGLPGAGGWFAVRGVTQTIPNERG